MHHRTAIRPHRAAELDARAQAMRSAPTLPEAVLWRAINAGKLGVCFRRQVPLAGRYIADFLAPRARLIVEVDGAQHARRTRADARRDRALARLGYRTVRIPAQLVLSDLAAAVGYVREALSRGG